MVAERMHHYFLLTMALVSGMIHSAYSNQTSLQESSLYHGQPLLGLSRHEQIKRQMAKSFEMESGRSTRDWSRFVQDIIFQANPKSVGLAHSQINGLSREVVRVSQCYGIDPAIFAALIWRESSFKPYATSVTGAVGLTQMTQSGIREVLERLRPSSPARFKSLRKLVQECNPKIYARLPAEVSADIVAAWKNSAMLSISDSLMLGAVLLKINLAHNKPRSNQTLEEIYRVALEKYNGDFKVKSRFAADVLQLSRGWFALSESKFLLSLQQF